MSENKDNDIYAELKKICHAYGSKSKFLSSLKLVLLKKHPNYRMDFSLVIMRLHNWLEDVCDRIIRNYIRPRQKDEWMYNEDIMKFLKAKLNPEEVRDYIVFNLNFVEKKNLLNKLFGLSKFTREFIKKLNNIRNAIAHRYDEDDKRYFYKDQNILQNYKALENFIIGYFYVLKEFLKIDTELLNSIDKAEEEYNLS